MSAPTRWRSGCPRPASTTAGRSGWAVAADATSKRIPTPTAGGAHTRTPEFLSALEDLVADVDEHDTTAVMCSESVWWRCHRRIVADAALLLRKVEVAHLSHDGKTTPHEPSAGARVVDGLLRYDAADT